MGEPIQSRVDNETTETSCVPLPCGIICDLVRPFQMTTAHQMYKVGGSNSYTSICSAGKMPDFYLHLHWWQLRQFQSSAQQMIGSWLLACGGKFFFFGGGHPQWGNPSNLIQFNLWNLRRHIKWDIICMLSIDLHWYNTTVGVNEHSLLVNELFLRGGPFLIDKDMI